MRKNAWRVRVAEKQRFTISLPEHVAEELARRSKALGSNPTEYAADIIRWWFGKDSPPLSEEEARVLSKTTNKRAS